jgi:putative transposase
MPVHEPGVHRDAEAHGMQIIMDNTGCWRGHVFGERLWRSLTYEEVYLHAYETVRDAQQGFDRYGHFYKSSQAASHA